MRDRANKQTERNQIKPQQQRENVGIIKLSTDHHYEMGNDVKYVQMHHFRFEYHSSPFFIYANVISEMQKYKIKISDAKKAIG